MNEERHMKVFSPASRYAERLAQQRSLPPGFDPTYAACRHSTLADALAEDAAAVEAGSVVYYAQRGDGLIKIGTSADPLRRLAELGRVYGALDLLITEPGALNVEVFRHDEMCALWAVPAVGVPGGHEWFFPDQPLREHLARIGLAENRCAA